MPLSVTVGTADLGVRRMKKLTMLALSILPISACVTPPGNITASYVNPASYRTLACNEIEREHTRVSTQESDLSNQQSANFAADTAMLTVGLTVFWPALLLMPVTRDHRHEIARMRGERDAMEIARTDQCSGAVTARIADPAPVSFMMAGSTTASPELVAPAVIVAGPRAWEFRCPVPGIVVAYSNQIVVTSGGPDGTDPRVCHSRVGSFPVRRLYGLVDVNGYGIQEYRSGLAPIYASAPSVPSGRESTFGTFRTLLNGVTNSFTERWRVIGEEDVQIAAGSYRAVVMEHRVEGIGSNYHLSTTRLWIDTSLGVLLKSTIAIERGTSLDRAYEAVRIEQARS
ncbi:MAG: hypothetical protein JWR10_2993 [Rubritepida sp.]|nr:hypothetical protein [Rubritepida sp.]